MIVPIYAEQDSEKKESIQQFLDRAAEQIRPNGRTFAETLVWLKETYGAEEFEPSVAERDKVRANILLNRPDLSQGMPTDYCQLLNWLADKPEVAGLDVLLKCRSIIGIDCFLDRNCGRLRNNFV